MAPASVSVLNNITIKYNLGIITENQNTSYSALPSIYRFNFTLEGPLSLVLASHLFSSCIVKIVQESLQELLWQEQPVMLPCLNHCG